MQREPSSMKSSTTCNKHKNIAEKVKKLEEENIRKKVKTKDKKKKKKVSKNVRIEKWMCKKRLVE